MPSEKKRAALEKNKVEIERFDYLFSDWDIRKIIEEKLPKHDCEYRNENEMKVARVSYYSLRAGQDQYVLNRQGGLEYESSDEEDVSAEYCIRSVTCGWCRKEIWPDDFSSSSSSSSLFRKVFALIFKHFT